ncbi:MAG: hypothetical protein ACREJC_11065 [Tepidisphaeraceae bacterium]
MREFLNSTAGKASAAGLIIVGLIAGFIVLRRSTGPSDAALASTDRMFIDSETGKTFPHTIEIGEVEPIKSPFTGRDTGFEPEYCYWTKDGKPKPKPTYVLLNSKKGGSEPTFCPDCGRLVVPLNPPASADSKPPPTEVEYKKSKSAGKAPPAG